MRAEDLHAELHSRDARWTAEKFDRKLAEALATSPVSRVAGRGGYLRYYGDERSGGTAGPGLYDSVERILAKHGLLGCRCREREVAPTARLKGVAGARWLIPDLVLCCHPKVGAQLGATVLHTIEVETSAGFSIESVYQAHAQGRGADYSWVLFSQRSPGLITHDEQRITWAATELGIGLISFSNPNSVNTWTVIRKAARRGRTTAEHSVVADLVARAMRLT